MKAFSLLLAVVFLSGVSCERHDFDGPNGTSQLQHHAPAAAGHGEHDASADHGDAAHEEHAEH